MAEPKPKSSSTIPTRRTTTRPPSRAPARSRSSSTSLLLALALLLGYDNWRTGMGWAPDGPQAGYFPFYLSVHPRPARRLYGLGAGRRAARGATTRPSSPATSSAACCRCSCRRCCSASLTQWLGLYVASFLLIAGFMRFVGRIALWKSLLTAFVFSLDHVRHLRHRVRRDHAEGPARSPVRLLGSARWKPSACCCTASPSC